jgi:hypothetical protein
MKETAGLSYVDLKDAVWMGLRGRMVGCTEVIEDWDMMMVCRRYLCVLWRSLSSDFWCFDGEM